MTLTESNVPNKADFYQRFHRGEFGNRILAWSSVDGLMASGYSGRVVVRSKKAGGDCCALPSEEAVAYCMGLQPGSYSVNMEADDASLILQGEAVRDPELRVIYSRHKGRMREALKAAPEHASGLAAHALLKSCMWPSCWEDFNLLLERYPDSAVEFSVYNVAVGVVPNRNTVFWEVRNY